MHICKKTEAYLNRYTAELAPDGRTSAQTRARNMLVASLGCGACRRNRTRRENDQAMRDLGLKKVRGAQGGTYWE